MRHPADGTLRRLLHEAADVRGQASRAVRSRLRDVRTTHDVCSFANVGLAQSLQRLFHARPGRIGQG